MADRKTTKKEFYAIIKGIVENSDSEQKDEVLAFIDKQVELLDAKAAKAQEKAAEKKAEGDELRAVVLSVVTDELQSADDITAQIDGEGITKAKVVARLAQLVKAETVVKDTIKTDDGRKVVAYKLA
jgi:hypothetical protein